MTSPLFRASGHTRIVRQPGAENMNVITLGARDTFVKKNNGTISLKACY